MKHHSEAQLAAIAHFERDYFPTLSNGIVSKDIVQAMRHDFAVLVGEPDVPLAVAKTDPAPSAGTLEEEAKLEAAAKFVGIRDEPTPRHGTLKPGKSK